jgi:hypothetical protein
MADEIAVTAVPEQAPAASQPQAPVFDDAAVREAIASAEAQGRDPERLKVEDLAQRAPVEEAPKPSVPEKFVKPDGEVDVEKLKASTRQLDEAIQKKESEVQKTVDDYVHEYRAKEAKFRTMPNPQRLAEGLTQTPPPPQDMPALSPQEIEARIAAEYQRNPIQTTLDLINVAAERKLAEMLTPIEQDVEMTRKEREDNRIRENLKEIAMKDPRVMRDDVFKAINAKLEAEPDLRRLKNPHKAAWLDVKEDLRLGEFSQAQAHPSRPASPILGGGTPPPAPSSFGAVNPRDPLASLGQFDLRDKKQEAAADAAFRAFLAQNER